MKTRHTLKILKSMKSSLVIWSFQSFQCLQSIHRFKYLVPPKSNPMACIGWGAVPRNLNLLGQLLSKHEPQFSTDGFFEVKGRLV